MPNNPYKTTIRSITTDGTNYYLEVEIFNGLHTFVTIRPAFDVSTTTADDIDAYVQAIADSQPVIAGDIKALVGKTYNGA